jgi:phage terminase large subunit
MRDLSDYADDPVGFVREVLGGDPWSRQVEILEALRDHPRVTVRSCHGVGKTYIAACAILWRLHCFRPSIVLTTAPSHRQVKDVLWRQLRKLQNRAKRELPGEVRETAIKISEDTFALGFATDEGERFQGFHSPHIFIVVEEASGVADGIFEAIDGCLTTEGAKILLIGNPTQPAGYFRDTHHREGWKKLHVSAFDSPNIADVCLPIPPRPKGKRRRPVAAAPVEPVWPTPVRRELVSLRWVTEKADEWGLDSPVYQVRVLGDFPDAGDDTLFPLSWVEAANQRFLEEQKSFSLLGRTLTGAAKKSLPGKQSSPHLQTPLQDDCLPIEIGVDVARYGSCETVVVVRRGTRVTRLEAWMGQDLMTTAGRVVAIAREEAACGDVWIKIDEIGMGGGPLDRLRESDVARELKALGIRVLGVNVAERPRDPERYELRRDEILFSLRDRFRTGQISVPPDDRLTAQLTSLRYFYTSRGRLQVESKEKLRERGLRSPDRADALALAFAPLAHGAPGYAGCGHGRAGVQRLST